MDKLGNVVDLVVNDDPQIVLGVVLGNVGAGVNGNHGDGRVGGMKRTRLEKWGDFGLFVAAVTQTVTDCGNRIPTKLGPAVGHECRVVKLRSGQLFPRESQKGDCHA